MFGVIRKFRPTHRQVRPPTNSFKLWLTNLWVPLKLALACSATPPSWHDRIPPPQSSPLLSVSTPDASSSPRGAFRGLSGGLGLHREMNSTDLSLLLGNGSLERSLLEAVEDLQSLNLGGGQKGPPPVLPERGRGSEGQEPPSLSPSLSGSSSPHSSSSSLPFSSPPTPDSPRGVGGVPSPGAGRRSRERAPLTGTWTLPPTLLSPQMLAAEGRRCSLCRPAPGSGTSPTCPGTKVPVLLLLRPLGPTPVSPAAVSQPSRS